MAKHHRAKQRIRFRDTAVSIEARSLWMLIETYADSSGANAFPRRETLAKLANKCLRWVDKYSRELRAAGWIKVRTRETKTGRVNLYTVLYPEALPIDREAL